MKICKKCGTIIDVIKQNSNDIVCCGEIMEELIPNTVEAAVEKHKPIYKMGENEITISVAEIPHPMLEEHHIEWISARTTKGIYRKNLKPEEEPCATFLLEKGEKVESIYSYCNLHGLWETKVI